MQTPEIKQWVNSLKTEEHSWKIDAASHLNAQFEHRLLSLQHNPFYALNWCEEILNTAHLLLDEILFLNEECQLKSQIPQLQSLFQVVAPRFINDVYQSKYAEPFKILLMESVVRCTGKIRILIKMLELQTSMRITSYRIDTFGINNDRHEALETRLQSESEMRELETEWTRIHTFHKPKEYHRDADAAESKKKECVDITSFKDAEGYWRQNTIKEIVRLLTERSPAHGEASQAEEYLALVKMGFDYTIETRNIFAGIDLLAQVSKDWDTFYRSLVTRDVATSICDRLQYIMDTSYALILGTQVLFWGIFTAKAHQTCMYPDEKNRFIITTHDLS